MNQNEFNEKLNLSLNAIDLLIKKISKSKIERIKLSFNEFELEIDSQKNQVLQQTSAASINDLKLNNNLSETEQLNFNESSENIITAPIVGVFYSSPAPNQPAFVEVGSVVKKGDVLYIIESMKLMNEIKSEVDGVVKKIFVKSGDAVEFEQKIMQIE